MDVLEVRMCRATIYDARNNFSALVKKAEAGEPVELTRHDKPVAVIISYKEYEERKPKKSFIDWVTKFKKENADVFEGFEGIPIPKDEYLDEAYAERIRNIWGEV